MSVTEEVSPSSRSIVYRYYDEAGVLLYVGITARGHRRLSEHLHTKEWWPFVASQEIDHHESPELAAEAERYLIQRHLPPFNTKLNPRAKLERDAYLAHRERASGPPMNIHEAWLAFGRRWEVGVVDNIAFTPPQYWRAVHLLEFDRHTTVFGPNGSEPRQGTIIEAPWTSGIRLVMPIQPKKDGMKDVATTATLVLKQVPGKILKVRYLSVYPSNATQATSRQASIDHEGEAN